MRSIEQIKLAYIAGFLDGDGSIFFQIIPRPDYKLKFQIRTSIAFYQKTQYVFILEWLKEKFGVGYIRHRKTEISDYTIVETKIVKKILTLLRPYVILKKKQIDFGLLIIDKLTEMKSSKDLLEICKLVDKFRELNYSKKRTITHEYVKRSLSL
jgi:hypothetical protein